MEQQSHAHHRVCPHRSGSVERAHSRRSTPARWPLRWLPTQSFGTINTNLTINGVAGTNVVQIAAIDLNNQTLTLNSPANSWFILNLSGQLKLAGASQIALAGGITPSNVLINMTGNGGLISIAGGTSGIHHSGQREQR